MQGFCDLDNDAIRCVLQHIDDAYTFISLGRCCERLSYLTRAEIQSRWCGFYAKRFFLSEKELRLGYPGANWQVSFQERLARLARLKTVIPENPYLLPAPTSSNGQSATVVPTMAVGAVRSENAGGRPSTPVDMDGLQALLRWFAEVPFMTSVPQEAHLEKCKALRRWIEEPHSFLARLRLLQTFDGVNLIFSTFSYVNGLGVAHEEAQESILGFFFILEVNFEGHRPGRPIGSLTPLRHQLAHSTSRANRKYALTLIYRYTQNDDTTQALIAEMDLISHVGVWLFENAQPPVLCSIGILSSVESEEGILQLRSIPNITERVMELLTWTHNFSVLTGALTLLRSLEVTVLISFNIFPTILQLIPTCLQSGIESHALMALLNLELLIDSPDAHAHLASSPIISELTTILRTFDRNRYRHIAKAILQVLRKLFLITPPDLTRASLCRQFRANAGVSLLQELASHYDASRRMTSMAMMDKLISLEANLQSNCVFEDDDVDDNQQEEAMEGVEGMKEMMDVDEVASTSQGEPKAPEQSLIMIPREVGLPNLTLPGFGAVGLGAAAAAAADGGGGGGGGGAAGNGNLGGGGRAGAPPDLPDLVADIYTTLSASMQDLVMELPEAVETMDLYCVDLLWVPLSILENSSSPSSASPILTKACLSYLHQLTLLTNPNPSQRRHIANIIAYVLAFLLPSWQPARDLIAHHHHHHRHHPYSPSTSPSPIPLPPAGPEMLLECLSMLAILLQHAPSSSDWYVQEDFSSTRMACRLLLSQLYSQEHLIDERLLQPTLVCLIHITRLMEWNDLIERAIAKVSRWLQNPELVSYWDLHLNRAILEAVVISKKRSSKNNKKKRGAVVDAAPSEIPRPEVSIPTSPCPLFVVPSSLLILASGQSPNASLLAFVAWSSLSSTPRGRTALRQFLLEHAQELRSASTLQDDPVVSSFASRLNDVLKLHPDVAPPKSRF